MATLERRRRCRNTTADPLVLPRRALLLSVNVPVPIGEPLPLPLMLMFSKLPADTTVPPE